MANLGRWDCVVIGGGVVGIGANLPSGNIPPLEPSFSWPFGKMRDGKFPGIRDSGHAHEATNSLSQDGKDPDRFTP